jgi:hypothetical protein
MNSDLPMIRKMLNDRADELARRLLPRGRRDGGLWVSFNPRVAGDDRKPPALKVRISGGDLGAWTDHRNGRDGARGDLIGLIEYLQSTDTKGALAFARDFLGLKAMSREERAAMQFAAEAAAQKAARQAEARRRSMLDLARRLWLQGQGPGSAAAAHARAYFAARKMPLMEIPALNPESFRYSPGTEWWKGAKWETLPNGQRRKLDEGPHYPAVHSAMRCWNGQIMACHVTFLDPMRAAKAPLDPPKLMLGEAKGAVIEISMGPDEHPFWKGADPHPLILAEGIETTGVLAIAVPEARVWAVGSISGFAHAPAGLDCVSEIYIARDNNHGNVQAQKQIDAAADALEAHGKPVAIMKSHVGDDFNDLA